MNGRCIPAVLEVLVDLLLKLGDCLELERASAAFTLVSVFSHA
jgi:hypothetical protein